MKKVLIVEDDSHIQECYKRFLEEEIDEKEIEVISAFNLEDAERLFNANPDLDLIVFDACVPGDKPNAPPLIRKFRETFAGPILATSSIPSFRRELVRAGCNYEVEDKIDVPLKVREILDLSGV